MIKENPGMWRRGAVVVLVLVVLAGAGWWWQRPPAPSVTTTQVDGATLMTAQPGGRPTKHVVIAATSDQHFDDDALLTLSEQTGAELVQFMLDDGDDCDMQQARLMQARKSLGDQTDLVVGLGRGGALAWRWLAGQDRDQAQALSAGFSVSDIDCRMPLPASGHHGKWDIVWNNDPDDATGRFVRGLEGIEVHTTIGDYGAASTTLAAQRLAALLKGSGSTLPTIPLPGQGDQTHSKTVTLYYSGDGGWRDLDQVSGEYMAAHGYPVVGVDTLKAFWQHRSPEQSAADLAALMATYRQQWGAKHFVLAGYSFGADILPALYNRLSPQDQQAVSAMILLAFSKTADFEIAVSGWLGQSNGETQTGPEVARVPPGKLVCIYGREEAPDSGCLQPEMKGKRIQLPGGHHFDQDYGHLAQIMIEQINQRLPAASQ
ncbi:virulence factor family protein [Kushneria sp. Sum13]|uniref:virulence factor family protein n=1 Tax=Kushneria sp. Sum13 TaxID=3459196 RepID=UPI0040456316